MAKKHKTRKSRVRQVWSALTNRDEPRNVTFRNWNAAMNNRFYSKFVADSYGLFDDDVRQDAQALRAQARDAEKNNAYVARYLKVITEKVIGPQGIRLRMAKRSKVNNKPDAYANPLLEGMWEQFSKSVTVDGLNLRETLNLFLRQTARDGEMFAIMHRGNNFGPHKLQLQLLDSEYLDLEYNGTLSNGNVIVQGIEYDKLYRRIAYHFFKQRPRTQAIQGTEKLERMRVLAKDVIHSFRRDRVSQSRGVPWYSASLITLDQISDYTKTELFAARMAASKQAFITQTNRDGQLPGDDDPDDENATVWEAGSGDIPVLDPGMKLESWDPTHPHGNFGAFVKHCLRQFCAEVEVSYSTISGDLESTSYSSARVGMIDERGTFRALQTWLVETVLDRLFEEWLRMVYDLSLANLADKFEDYNRPHWRCPKWAWVDPAKETAAIAMQLDYKIKSRTEAAREQGFDYHDVLDEIAEEQAYADAKGITFSPSELNRELARHIVESAVIEDDEKEGKKSTN